MNIQKIINQINSFFKIRKRKNTRKSNIFLNKNKQKSILKKRRKSIKIKNSHLEKLKIFGNNVRYYYIAIFLLLIILFIYLLFGPIFKIKSIEIIKQDNITDMQVAYKSVTDFRGMSIFQIDKKDVLKHMYDYQNNIKNIKTSIVLPDTFKVLVSSYDGLFNTIINEKEYIITQNGTLVPSSPSEKLETLIIKNQFKKNNFYDYKKTLDQEYISKINFIINSIKENIINLQTKEITYFVIEREVHIETENDITIIFDLNRDFKEQIEKLAIFNKEQISINKAPLIYIDLRIKNKIFYCSKKEEYKCIQNLKSIYPY